jgi:hypothetical protein
MAITREIERGQSLATGLAARLACHRGTTAAVAPGYVQGNLAALPADLAADFLRFCQSNPKPCPLIGVSDVGNPRIPSLGLDLDIRTDLPGYRVWNDGELVEETAEVRGRHAAAAYRTVATRTHVPQQYRLHARRPLLRPDGRFDAPAETAPGDPDHLAFPAVHGAPIHIGLPVWGHTTVGGRQRQATVRHYACARRHAGEETGSSPCCKR